MSKAAISGFVWAEMSEAQKIEAVCEGRATLKEMVEGLLDGPEKLHEACRQFLAHADVCLEQIKLEPETNSEPAEPSERNPDQEDGGTKEDSVVDDAQGVLMDGARKRRLGLPEGYVPKLHRH